MTNKKSIPFLAIGNEELNEKEPLTETHVMCKNCGKKHLVEYGQSKKLIDGKWSEPKKNTTLGFTTCGKKTFLVVIAGKLL